MFEISYILKIDNLKIIKNIFNKLLDLQFDLIFENLRNSWLWQKASNSVNAKVSYLCAGILNGKLAFSQATVVFEK